MIGEPLSRNLTVGRWGGPAVGGDRDRPAVAGEALAALGLVPCGEVSLEEVAAAVTEGGGLG